MHRLNIPIIWTSVFELDVDPRTGTTKASYVKERLDQVLTICYHSRFSMSTPLGDLCGHLMQMRILTFDIEYDIHISSENHEGNGYGYKLSVKNISEQIPMTNASDK